MSTFLWVVFPYIALTIAVVGTLFRYDSDPYGWQAKSSQILERRQLFWGSNLFHLGIIFAFVGHVMGILVPLWLHHALGVSDHLYHLNALVAGGAAGIACVVGLLILAARRFGIPRILRNSTALDIVGLSALILTVVLGTITTFFARHEYRLTVGPWFRTVLMLNPDPRLMISVPWFMQVHVLTGLLVFAITPFTRIIHFWSLPIAYLRRAPIQFRFRTPVTSAPESRHSSDPEA